MCKTAGATLKRPRAFGNGETSSAFSAVVSSQASFFPNFFNTAGRFAQGHPDQLLGSPAPSFNHFPPMPFSSSWPTQLPQQQLLLSALCKQQRTLGLDLLSKPSLSAVPLQYDSLFVQRKAEQTSPPSPPSSEGIPSSLLMQNSLSMQPVGTRHTKKSSPEVVSDSNSERSAETLEKSGETPAKKQRLSKKKHEATLDGERRVAIEFETFGKLGSVPQTYGKSALIVPDGLTGKYSAFGQRWRFTITHAVGPVICEDGVLRMCLAWSVTNLNSSQTHTVVETPSDAMKRDRDGKTLCNRVFRDALSLRASALESELRKTNDPCICIDLQSQLRNIQTKRFSEGPLFFGLRHCTLQNEMKKELEKRTMDGAQTENS